MTVFNVQGDLNHTEYKNHQCAVTAKQLEDMPIVDENAVDLIPENLPQFLISRAQRNLAAIFAHVKKDSKILDIGCRTGIYLWFLKQNGFTDLHGIEIDDSSVEVAKKRGLEVVSGDAHKLPYADNFFSAVSCTQVIEHAYSPSTVLKEMRRVLNRDGVLWIDAPLEGVNAYNETYNHAGHHCFWTSPEEFGEFLSVEFKTVGHQIYLYPPDQNGKVWAQGMGFLCRQK
jgi:SAM-dependent methyltransferase